jgi:hypothetical protein
MFDESVMESQSKIPSDESVYNDAHSVISIISQLKGIADAVISECEIDYNIGAVRSIEYIGGSNYILLLTS